MVSDLQMPAMNGLELLEQALALEPNLSVVMLTAYGSIETAVAAVKAGAYDFLTKPVDKEELFRVVVNALERSRLLGENLRLKELMAKSGMERSFIGRGPAMVRLKEAVAAVAQSDYTVLIRGESGTGKELAARTIHSLSPRAAKPLVAVNCPAIPDELIESELFGHVRGAFTGADRHRKGLFASAHGGAILLDEIGDLRMDIQTKLLRVLQEQEIRPVGSSGTVKVDARIMASTNQDLERKLQAGAFREDLFYRLNVLTVHMPPLRERTEDIPLLAHHFLAETCGEMGLAQREITPEALSYLASRPWPGNVRELLNLMRRVVVFSTRETVDLPLIRLAEQGAGAAGQDRKQLLPYHEAKAAVTDDFTRTYVRELLAATGGNISEAARVSGMARLSLQKILKRLDLDADEFR
jgi:DNA-binding NtrC family response regulator